MGPDLPEVFRFEAETLNHLVIERVRSLEELRAKMERIETEIQFLRQALRLLREDVFPERPATQLPDHPPAAFPGSAPTIEERILVALLQSPAQMLSNRQLLERIQRSPHPINGSSPMATLMTTLRRSPMFTRVPERPMYWRVVPEALNPVYLSSMESAARRASDNEIMEGEEG